MPEYHKNMDISTNIHNSLGNLLNIAFFEATVRIPALGRLFSTTKKKFEKPLKKVKRIYSNPY